ncbi:MAG: GNAT family N-acetyltransferase [Anaerolineae bacterium]
MDSHWAVNPVTTETWGDFEVLFESRGCPGYCWCMAWRTTPQEATVRGHAARKAMIKARIDAGTPVGILGYLNGEPAAWCSIAPKETYRKLDDLEPSGPEETVWSLVCFFVRRHLRGQGVSRIMLRDALSYARESGATVVEAYPVDPDSPSYRFMGFVPLYEAFGFVEVGRAGKRRHVMRLRLAG